MPVERNDLSPGRIKVTNYIAATAVTNTTMGETARHTHVDQYWTGRVRDQRISSISTTRNYLFNGGTMSIIDFADSPRVGAWNSEDLDYTKRRTRWRLSSFKMSEIDEAKHR